MFSQFALIVFHAIFWVCSCGDNTLRPQDRYNEDIALFFAHVSSSVYCPADKISNWNCASCSASAPFLSTKVVRDEKKYLQGVVAYSSTMKKIVIGFRGSSNAANLLSSLDYTKTSPYTAYKEAALHEGFYNMYQQIAEQVVNSVKEIVKEYPNVFIRVTGHSLGGALAMICAFELKLLHKFEVEAIYTFGQPRVGNHAFAKMVEDLVPNYFRVIHNKDIVVHLPALGLNFRHSGVEVWYDEKYTKYKTAPATPVKTKIAHLGAICPNAAASTITTTT